MLFDLIQCEYSLPVETGFLNMGPVLKSIFEGWQAHSEVISTGFKVVVMGNGHKVAAFLPAQFWLLRQPEPVRKSFS